MQALEEKLQYHFKNPALLEEALRHSSYANEHRGANFFSNERLEFLGDSVLGFVTAEYLFAKHPTAPEGELTRIRALLVCEDSLHEVAQRLELGKYLKLGNGEESCGGRTRPSILADATEAVFAAVYLDGGMEPARALILRCLGHKTEEAIARPARSSTAYCSTPSARRSPRKSAATTRPFCRNSCSARRTRRFPTACLVRAAPTMTRRSILKCCSTAALWARARAAARRKPSRWPQKTRSKN